MSGTVRHYPLVVAIRCHKWPKLVLDAVDAVFHHARTFPLVVLQCDANPAIGPIVQAAYPQVRYYLAPTQWGWGAGLYGLLSDTISWLDAMPDITYDHFVSIDYDTLVIGRDFDGILMRVLGTQPHMGLAGCHAYNSANWEEKYRRSRSAIERTFADARVPFPPPTYKAGESCLGGFMWLTPQCRRRMTEMGLFRNPFRDIRGRIDMADDPWMALLVRAAGFDIYDIRRIDHYGHIFYQNPGDWRTYPQRGLRVFNLGWISRAKDKTEELTTRNFFRRIRGCKHLLTVADGAP